MRKELEMEDEYLRIFSALTSIVLVTTGVFMFFQGEVMIGLVVIGLSRIIELEIKISDLAKKLDSITEKIDMLKKQE